MDEIARFLRECPPFDQLPSEVLSQTAGTVEIEYFPRGARILTRGGKPSDFLYIIRAGAVELRQVRDGGGVETVDTLAEGETFGHLSLLSGAASMWDAVAREEMLAYLIPRAQVERLHHYAAFDAFFARNVRDRLQQAVGLNNALAPFDLFSTRAADLVRRPPVTCEPTLSVREAAERMRAANVSSVVVAGEPLGILTDRDLRNRVLAEGRSHETPVAAVMSAPAIVMPAGSLLGEVLLTMVERAIHHVPLVEAGCLVGILTDTDLIRHESQHPLFLPRQLERARGIEGLITYADQVATSVGSLVAGGLRASDIARIVTLAYDALIVRIVREAEAALGEPPAPYAFLVLGSGGRQEQTIRTDQDHALVLADDAPADADDYFAALAERIVTGLERCGFPRCPGEIMASNPDCRHSLSGWQHRFGEWIERPEEQALLDAAVFFDFRRLYGTLDVEAALRPVIGQAATNRVFLARLARAGLQFRPPLGFFRQFVVEKSGEHKDAFDLKKHGTGIVVNLARLFALEAGIGETGTLSRLRLAAGKSSLDPAAAEELAAAFEYLQSLRLRHQGDQERAGQPRDNFIAPAALSSLERRHLKDAFHVIATTQKTVELIFHTARVA